MRIIRALLVLALALLLTGGSALAFVPCDADLNGDGVVNLTDVVMFASDYYLGTNPPRSDFNGDGIINLTDIVLLAQSLGTTGC